MVPMLDVSTAAAVARLEDLRAEARAAAQRNAARQARRARRGRR
jgi:hypothetical protein